MSQIAVLRTGGWSTERTWADTCGRLQNSEVCWWKRRREWTWHSWAKSQLLLVLHVPGWTGKALALTPSLPPSPLSLESLHSDIPFRNTMTFPSNFWDMHSGCSNQHKSIRTVHQWHVVLTSCIKVGKLSSCSHCIISWFQAISIPWSSCWCWIPGTCHMRIMCDNNRTTQIAVVTC